MLHNQKLWMIVKQKPSKVNLRPYNTVILKLLKSNMNLQFSISAYAMLTWLTSYLCKPEYTVSELMKKASKETYSKDIRDKMHSIGNIFLTKRKVSTHKTIKQLLPLSMTHSNIYVLYVAIDLKNKRARMLKSLLNLKNMLPDDKNVFESNIDKYENRPDNLTYIQTSHSVVSAKRQVMYG